MLLSDSHCHLSLLQDQFSVQDVVDEAARDGVHYLLCVAIDLDSGAAGMTLADAYEGVSASVGVHPNHDPGRAVDMDMLRRQAACAQVVAIGETGLDYFRSEGDLSWQRERFRDHIRLARDFAKPLIIHCRQAKEDVIRILREEGAEEVGGIMHCFVEDWETAAQAMDLNFYISLSGIVTFKNAGDLRAVARRLPLSRLLVETDSPYLAPEPHRGKINRPAYVRCVAEYLAELKSIPLAELANQTTENYLTLTGLAQ